MEQGVDIDMKDRYGDTALIVAVRTRENLELVKLFLEYGADPNASDKKGWTPLHIASLFGHRDIAKLLLDRGAIVDRKDNSKYDALANASLK